jgi:hypothetical protein
VRALRRLSAALAAASTAAVLVGCGGGTATTTSATSGATAPTTVAPVAADDIPVAHTPPGGYGASMPAPVLAACTEPLAPGAPDLRGMWRAVAVEVGGRPAPDHPQNGHVERVEQCGDRVVVTAGGVVHDMRADGTAENGVDDVAARDFTTPISVVATFEDGVLVLRPVDLPGVEIRRRLDGDVLVWDYVGFTARLERLGPPEAPPPPDTSRSTP